MVPEPGNGRLSWDPWNLEHIEKHDVLVSEVNEVFQSEPIFREPRKNGLLAIGPTFAGRTLAVVIGPDPMLREVYDVFSARPASRKERGTYLAEQGT